MAMSYRMDSYIHPKGTSTRSNLIQICENAISSFQIFCLERCREWEDTDTTQKTHKSAEVVVTDMGFLAQFGIIPNSSYNGKKPLRHHCNYSLCVTFTFTHTHTQTECV